jgi:hypothetical protein
MCDLEREIRLVLSGYVLLGQGPPLLAPIVSNFLALRSSRNHAPQAQDRDRDLFYARGEDRLEMRTWLFA